MKTDHNEHGHELRDCTVSVTFMTSTMTHRQKLPKAVGHTVAKYFEKAILDRKPLGKNWLTGALSDAFGERDAQKCLKLIAAEDARFDRDECHGILLAILEEQFSDLKPELSLSDMRVIFDLAKREFVESLKVQDA